jgi:polysaccharide deacetylase family protein (PEP-CTERM system associated)
MLNALTVDLEDWAQSTLGPDTPITDRFVSATRAVLRLFRSCQVKATFFALGKAVELYPDVLKEVRDEGHEIGSHGYGHELVHTITPERFRGDVIRGLEVVEGITGVRPIGYRAPAFSINRETMWAGPILAELGFAYSSSIFPFAGPRYGIPDAPRGPHRWSTCDLWELPMSTLKVAGRNRPVCGGGYTRLLPFIVLSRAVARLNREGLPAVLYMHPYELDVHEVKELRRQGWSIGRRIGFEQSLFRGRVAVRLRALLGRYPFGPAATTLGLRYDGKPGAKVNRNR